jgi:hypothetical protein
LRPADDFAAAGVAPAVADSSASVLPTEAVLVVLAALAVLGERRVAVSAAATYALSKR